MAIDNLLNKSKFTDTQKDQLRKLDISVEGLSDPDDKTSFHPTSVQVRSDIDASFVSFKRYHPSIGFNNDTYEFIMIPQGIRQKIIEYLERSKIAKNIAHIRFTSDYWEDIEYISINNSRLDANGCMIGFNTSPTKTIWYNTAEIRSIGLSTDVVDKPITGQGVDE